MISSGRYFETGWNSWVGMVCTIKVRLTTPEIPKIWRSCIRKLLKFYGKIENKSITGSCYDQYLHDFYDLFLFFYV